MTTSLEQIPFLSELGETELKDLLSKKSNDPAFTQHAEAWSLFIKEIIGESVDFFENRSILVCHVLAKNGFGDLLEAAEEDQLDRFAPKLQIALRDSAGLRAIEHRIGQEIVDFKEAWLIHEGSEEKTSLIDSKEVSEWSRWQPVSQTRRSSWKLMVAGFSLVVASVFVFNNLDSGKATILSFNESIETVSLPDGSSVRLIPGAVLKYYENEDSGFERQVELTGGKAFFDIVKSTKPFSISTPNAEAIVLGTSFGMEANRYFTEVVLAEGSVVLVDASDGNDKVILEPGQMSRVTSEGEVSRPHRVDVVDALHWTEMFVFRSTQAGLALKGIAEHYGVEIKIAEELKQMKINATYDYKVGVDYIVETISETLGADVLRTARGFELTI